MTDPAGDTSAALGVVSTPAPPGSDLLSFQIAQPFQADGIPRLVFTINTDNGQAVQPAGSAWYVAMQIVNGADVRYKGVHMAWEGPTPTFRSYTPGANNAGGVDGRFVDGELKAAEAGSSYAAPYNKVVIIVKASDLGLGAGDTIGGFVAGVSQTTDPGGTVGAGATALYDQMPDSLGFTGNYTIVANGVCSASSLLDSAVSRKAHGSAGVFEIPLPLDGSGIESRLGVSPNADTHQIVFKFLNPITVGSVSATASSAGGPQAVSASGQVNPTDAKEYIVTASGVPNAQNLTVTLNNVSDTGGNSVASLNLSVGMLAGDVNGSRIVSGADVNAVKAQQSQEVSQSNFLSDVNVSGVISGADVNATKSRQSTALP